MGHFKAKGEDISKITPIKSIEAIKKMLPVKKIQEVKEMTEIDDDIANKFIEKYGLKNQVENGGNGKSQYKPSPGVSEPEPEPEPEPETEPEPEPYDVDNHDHSALFEIMQKEMKFLEKIEERLEKYRSGCKNWGKLEALLLVKDNHKNLINAIGRLKKPEIQDSKGDNPEPETKNYVPEAGSTKYTEAEAPPSVQEVTDVKEVKNMEELKNIKEVKSIDEIESMDEIKEMLPIKSIDEVKDIQEVESMQEVKNLYELPPSQAQQLEQLISSGGQTKKKKKKYSS